MTDSQVAVTEGSGKNLRTNQRTVNSQTVQEQYQQRAEPFMPTFSVYIEASMATADEHMLAIMADGTNYTRLLYWEARLNPADLPASDSNGRMLLRRLTSAGSGGTAEFDQPFEDTQSYTGDIRVLPTSKGTDGVLLNEIRFRAPATAENQMELEIYKWRAGDRQQPIIFGPATSDGIVWSIPGAIASADMCIYAEFAVTDHL